MASSSSTAEPCDTGLCPICREKYNIPRSLATCGHVFCEKCLLNFVLNLKENGKLESNFQCPVCQEAHPVQDSEHVTLEWIKTFPLCEEYAAANDESTILSSKDDSPRTPCGPCEDNGISISGEKYCKDCEAYLCGDCITIHSKFKPLKGHKIFEDPSTVACKNIYAVVNQFKKCPKHPTRDAELFCKDKEELLCLMCSSTTHKVCYQDVDIASSSGLSKTKTESILGRIMKSQEHLKKLQSLSNENRKLVNDKLETLVKEVETIRKNVIRSLDDIYEKVHARKKRIKIDMEDQLFAATQTSEQMHEDFEQKRNIMDSVLKHGDPTEIFAVAIHFEEEIDKLEREVFQFDKNFTLRDVDSACINELKKTAEQFDPENIPSIEITHGTASHEPRFTIPLETHIHVPYEIENVVKHRIELTDKCSPSYTGLSIQHSGTIVLCDNCGADSNCGHLCLYDIYNKKKQKLKMYKPFCATFLDNKSIVVTLSNEKTIVIISTGLEMRSEKSLKTIYVPRSIATLKNGTVAISWAYPPGFSISDISGATVEDKQYFTRDSDGRKFKYFDYMAIDERRGHVIQPCIKDKAVYCFDLTANPVFKYTHDIKKPQGVAVDTQKGDVFVCDIDSNSIHQITFAGNPITIITHEALREPLAISFDMQRNCIWVTNENKYRIVTCYEQK